MQQLRLGIRLISAIAATFACASLVMAQQRVPSLIEQDPLLLRDFRDLSEDVNRRLAEAEAMIARQKAQLDWWAKTWPKPAAHK